MLALSIDTSPKVELLASFGGKIMPTVGNSSHYFYLHVRLRFTSFLPALPRAANFLVVVVVKK